MKASFNIFPQDLHVQRKKGALFNLEQNVSWKIDNF